MDQAQRAGLRYMIELFVVMAIYVLLLFARPSLLHLWYGTAWNDAVMIAPALPLWGAFWVVVRHYRRLDEYLKLELLQIMAVCFGFAACITASYAFFRDAFAWPDISIAYAWNVMAVCWLVATFVVQFRNRGSLSCTTN